MESTYYNGTGLGATYVLFNQKGRVMAESDSLAYLFNTAMAARFRYFFITNLRGEVVMDEMRGRALPKRTSRGTVVRLQGSRSQEVK